MTPQYPRLLDGYAARPTWAVAGVDYAVGPTYAPVKDPATMSIPNVSVDTAGHLIIVNADDVSIDGYDFTIGGNSWSIKVRGKRCSITNNRLGGGANSHSGLIYVYSTDVSLVSDLYIGHNILDGAGCPAGIAALVNVQGNCDGLVVEQNWLKNPPSDFIDHGYPISATIQDNLFDTYAPASSAGHGDGWQQYGSGTTSKLRIIGNTLYHPGSAMVPSAQINSSFELVTQGTLPLAITDAEVRANTIIIPPRTADSNKLGYALQARTSVAGSFVTDPNFEDNYLDVRGAWGALYPTLTGGVSGARFVNNVNLNDGMTFSAPF
jgi:hypothetical protein